MNWKFRFAVLAWFSLAGLATAEDRAINLDGTYTIESGERDGKPIPPEELKGAIIKIQGDKMSGTDKDKKMFFGCTFQVDRTTKPMNIRMVSTAPIEGEKSSGIIEMSGDSVKLCYALPGGEVPKEFKTTAKQHCFVLKKVTR